MTIKPAPQLDPKKVREMIELNFDARQYFYSKANENLLDWLWKNGFLDEIKQPADDTTRYSYKMPELGYLVSMADRSPDKVTDIVLAIKSTKDHFNPEVIDRFTWIAGLLPADQIKRLAPKIREEEWVRLMVGFNRWGFEYEKMIEKLVAANDKESILTLAESILSIRTKEDMEKTKKGLLADNPFCFEDLSHTKIFEALANINDGNAEDALALTTKVMSEIIAIGGNNNEAEVFKVKETFFLFDVDFFTLKPGQKEHLSYRDGVKELAAVIKTIAESILRQNPDRAREVYNKYIQTLPDSRAMYRLRLYILSLNPDTFKAEIKSALFRIFEYEKPWDLVSGAEYERLLQTTFGTLSPENQREYISKILEFPMDDVHKFAGHDILSTIKGFLTKEENDKADQLFGELKENHEPEPSIRELFAGTVVPQAPGEDEDWLKPVDEIVGKMKSDWTPQKLQETYKNEDYLRPVDAEGVGDRLKREIAAEPLKYLSSAEFFFDPETLDSHYTYSYLLGVDDLLRENKLPEGTDLSAVIKLLKAISQFTTFRDPSRKDTSIGWLANWDAVHHSMGDVLKHLLYEVDGNLRFDFSVFRQEIFDLIKYLFNHRDPEPKDEVLETAKSKVKPAGKDEYEVSDPYTMAINSVRGRAFESLASFAYLDGKRIKSEGKNISDDVKKLYSEALQHENTQAVMFMFGHYIPQFYYRDIDWFHQQMPYIFPADKDKQHLYLAAWEGYLTSNLYFEIFDDPEFRKLYERGIALSSEEYVARRYFREIDEGLATHLALAFVYRDDFDLTHPLFEAFWKDDNEKRHAEFISFIGRAFVSGSGDAHKFVKDNEQGRKQLKIFWDWALENCNHPEALKDFGFWMKIDESIFEISWITDRIKKTLQKTQGLIDWDHGLMTTITEIAKVAPQDALDILRSHLLDVVTLVPQRHGGLYVDDYLFTTLTVIYDNPSTKTGVESLINDLITAGGITFWKLKEILEPTE